MPATSTTRLGLRKLDTDIPINVLADFNAAMDSLDAAAGFEPRTDFPSNPFQGKSVARTDQISSFSTGPTLWFYTGTGWAEIKLRGTHLEAADETNQTRTGSTAYTAGSPVLSLSFVAPASGAVFITLTGALEATTTATAALSYELRETDASGTVIAAASSDREVSRATVAQWQGDWREYHSGLTPFQTYYVQTMHKVTNAAETASILYRKLMIERD